MKAIITVVGPDRVGIIAEVCTLLAEMKISVVEISQTIMEGYFTMMMAICSVLTKLSEEDCADERLKTLWNDLKAYDERMYRRARYGVVGFFTNLRGRAGDKTTLGLYRLASKIFKFN